MSSTINLYKGPELTPFAELALADVLRPSLENILRRDLLDCSIVFSLSPAPVSPRMHGHPPLYNLFADYGYGTIIIRKAGITIYRHPHSVEELIGLPLQQVLAKEYPEERDWAYRIAGPGLPVNVVRRAPLVDGVFDAPDLPDGDTLELEIVRMPEPEPPPAPARLLDLEHPKKKAEGSRVSVVMTEQVDEHLRRMMTFSSEVEEGGFLSGQVYRDPAADDAFIVHVTGVPRAEHTGASFLHFTFTGDSFRSLKVALAAQNNQERLLGWYHTHLFAATDEFGLSTVDVDLHLTTFSQPWQVAGLINLNQNERTIRYYARANDTLMLCPMRVAT